MKLLHTFLYFAIFKYPLTKEEALKFSQYKTASVIESLELLVKKKKIFKIGEYYLPKEDPSWVTRRQKGSALAKKKMFKAKRMSKILNAFPLVRSVMISGSLSKGYMDEESDIDFFVIMKPGNIAISKFLIGSFRRLFARNSLCVNFLIDYNHLSIESRNLYTAMEIVTLIPLSGGNLYNDFIKENLDWVYEYLPNISIEKSDVANPKQTRIKNLLEYILSLPIANWLNNRLLRIYLKTQSSGSSVREESHKNGELVIHKGVFKGHRNLFQKKILTIYKNSQQQVIEKQDLELKEYFYE